jgi:drug/metabolite transporter (DMT)-like permease
MPFAGEFAALFTALLWSVSSLLFAAAAIRVGWFTLNVSRLAMAAFFLSLLVLIVRPDFHISSRQLFLLAISGIIGLAIGDGFLFRAYEDVGARITMLIMSLAPAFAALLARIFLGETLNVWALAGMVITLAGIGLVIATRNNGDSVVDGAAAGTATVRPAAAPAFSKRNVTTGFFCATLASVGQAAGLTLSKLAFNEAAVNGFFAALVRIAASLAILLPIVLMKGRSRVFAAYRQDRRALALTGAGAIFGPFLGISFSLISVTFTSVAISSTLMATVPIMMLPLVRVIYKETLSWRAIAGAVIAVAGVGLLFLR